MLKSPTFTRLKDSTPEDWIGISAGFAELGKGLPQRILAHLKLLDGDFGGFPVDRYQHSLQTATRALRDGRDEEYVVCALLHDVGDTLGTFNHPEVAAAILKPFISEANLWMIEHHGLFQAYHFFHHLGRNRNLRDQYAGHRYYERTWEFVELYDEPAFDPSGETLPISVFEPMVCRLFAKPVNSIYGSSSNAKAL
jgi:predicted HD phosphohydrolase